MTDAESGIGSELADRIPRSKSKPSTSKPAKHMAGGSHVASRKRRGHPAIGARIASTGVSTAAMFTIVAWLGLNSSPETAGTPEPVVHPTTTALVEDVSIKPPTLGPVPTLNTTVSNRAVADQKTTADSGALSQPIELTANPVLRAPQPAPQVTAPAPVAKTNGSR